jgi:gliding-associated putative ABC transporter substrate-binding component GldG
MIKRQVTIITIFSVIVFILAFMVSGRLWFRLDLTKNKAYTISEVSRNLYMEIPEYIDITYYISDKLKNVHPMPREIDDTLRVYAAYSKGKIRVKAIDPVKAELTRVVEELGLHPMQIRNVEKDQASLLTVYSGIVIEYLDKTEILPWVDSTGSLEYDLTSRIRSMVTDTERSLGIIAGDSYRQWKSDFGYLNQFLVQAGYKIRLIPPGDEIPDNLPAVFVLGGVESLDAWALYRIDRYIQMGGKVLFAVKGIFVDTLNGTLEARKQNDQGLLEMIASYGITIRPEIVLDRSALTIQYQNMLSSGAVQYRISRYPLWIGVLAENSNPSHPVSARFNGIDLYWASPLDLHPSENVEVTELFSSTPEAWLMRDVFYTSPEISYLFERDAAGTRGKKILGASLSGELMSFFRDAPKPVREGSDEELPDMPQKTSSSRIIVIGDTDFTTSMINASGGSYQNLDFLLRAADWLVSDDDIISIRNRQPQAGRLDRIIDEDKKSLAILFAQVVNVGIIPLLVIITGIVLAAARRSRARYAQRNAEQKSIKESSNAI